jgi:hypothetical protein
MFSSNIVRGMQLKHTWSIAFFGGRILNFRIFFWTWDSPELVKCGIQTFLSAMTRASGGRMSYNNFFVFSFVTVLTTFAAWLLMKHPHFVFVFSFLCTQTPLLATTRAWQGQELQPSVIFYCVITSFAVWLLMKDANIF